MKFIWDSVEACIQYAQRRADASPADFTIVEVSDCKVMVSAEFPLALPNILGRPPQLRNFTRSEIQSAIPQSNILLDAILEMEKALLSEPEDIED